MSFEKLGINLPLIEGLKKEDITVPTEIQAKAIPIALANRDLVGESETGTGKTLAYLLPIFQKVNHEIKEMQVIVLVPTHELAIQIQRQVEILATNSGLPVTSTPIIGNANINRQIDKLKEKPHIIVGSPGRILELIKKKKISAHTVKTIVIDEADRLLDEHNQESVKAVIKTTLKERQLLLFSATIPPKTVEIANEIMKEPVFIKGEEKFTVASTISHLYFIVEKREKFAFLRKVIAAFKPEKAIVFINKSEEIDMVTSKLKYHNFKAEGIHGTSFQAERKKAMEDFRTGKIQLLVASDLAARGLDIEGVTHVFNLDLPEDPKFYLHRVGRTGRAGASGTAISIVSDFEERLIKNFGKVLNVEFELKELYKGQAFEAEGPTIKRQPKPMKSLEKNLEKVDKRGEGKGSLPKSSEKVGAKPIRSKEIKINHKKKTQKKV